MRQNIVNAITRTFEYETADGGPEYAILNVDTTLIQLPLYLGTVQIEDKSTGKSWEVGFKFNSNTHSVRIA